MPVYSYGPVGTNFLNCGYCSIISAKCHFGIVHNYFNSNTFIDSSTNYNPLAPNIQPHLQAISLETKPISRDTNNKKRRTN